MNKKIEPQEQLKKIVESVKTETPNFQDCDDPVEALKEWELSLNDPKKSDAS